MDYSTKMLSDSNMSDIEQTVDKFITNMYGNVKYEIEFLGILKDSLRKERIVTLDVFFKIDEGYNKMILDIIYEPDYSILYISKLETFEYAVSPFTSSFISKNQEVYSIFTYI